ncbi:MAG TPA: hypothetical protein VGG79_23075 [Roseiarcus sp.]
MILWLHAFLIGFYNRRASSLQAKPSKFQAKMLFMLGFVWWKRDFSKGYRGKNKNNFPAPNSRYGLWLRGFLGKVSPLRARRRPSSKLFYQSE